MSLKQVLNIEHAKKTAKGFKDVKKIFFFKKESNDEILKTVKKSFKKPF